MTSLKLITFKDFTGLMLQGGNQVEVHKEILIDDDLFKELKLWDGHTTLSYLDKTLRYVVFKTLSKRDIFHINQRFRSGELDPTSNNQIKALKELIDLKYEKFKNNWTSPIAIDFEVNKKE